MRVRLILVAVALLLGGGALYFWQAGWPSPSWIEGGKAATNQHVAEAVTGDSAPVAATLGRALPADDKAGGSGVARVAVTPVRKSEVPIYLSGIGTVQAYYKIDITAQVDGIITKMPFEEGQDVKVGDTLVEHRPDDLSGQARQAQAQARSRGRSA